MGTFKVGDKVKVIGQDVYYPGWIGEEATFVSHFSPKSCHIRFENGQVLNYDYKNIEPLPLKEAKIPKVYKVLRKGKWVDVTKDCVAKTQSEENPKIVRRFRRIRRIRRIALLNPKNPKVLFLIHRSFYIHIIYATNQLIAPH